MDHDTIQLKNVLRKYLNESQLSQAEFARALSIPHPTFHSYLYGRVPRGLTSIIKMAKSLRISLDQLVLGESRKSQK